MESLIISALSGYLREYIKDFHAEQMGVNLFSGTTELKDVELDVNTMNKLLDMDQGCLQFESIQISSLKIEVPYLSLSTQHIVVSLGHVFIEVKEVENAHKTESKPTPTKSQNNK